MRRLIGITAVLTVAITAALAFGTARAGAGLLGCSGSYSQPFSPWTDYSSYGLAPSGSFEGGTSGWTLAGNARVVQGNEPFYVNSRSDSRSLQLSGGGSALTPGICLGTLDPKARLFGRSSDGSGVHVDVYAKGLLGVLRLATSANVPLGTTWGPTQPVSLLLDNVLALSSLGTTTVYFRFSPIGSATVQIDDVYVDPIFHE